MINIRVFKTANIERWEAGMDVSSYEAGKNVLMHRLIMSWFSQIIAS